MPHQIQMRCLHPLGNRLEGKSGAEMRVLLAQEFKLMRCKVDHKQSPLGSEHACGFTDRSAAVVEIVEHLVNDHHVEGVTRQGQIVNIALPDAAVPQARPLEPGARQQQHRGGQINPKPDLSLPSEELEHSPGAGTKVEQRTDWVIAKGRADRGFDGDVRGVQPPDSVPLPAWALK